MLQLARSVLVCSVLCGCAWPARGHGFMLLYRPRDVTGPCALSQYLRYDISYGMGMSDTITLVFRTVYEMDYECTVDIVGQYDNIILLIVVRYPNLMGSNCEVNDDAITVLKKERCLRLCDFVQEPYSPYTVFPVQGRLRFRFISNSSVNTDLNASVYQVTATAARASDGGCFERNETVCTVNEQHFCFTSGVVCDGIGNCGVSDWFDERKSECNLPIEKLGVAPVVAVAAALLCAALAVGSVLVRCLPAQAESYFIFNANEDNRLCIDPSLQPRGGGSPEPEKERRASLIPIYSSSSSESGADATSAFDNVVEIAKPSQLETGPPKDCQMVASPGRKLTMRTLTAKIQNTIRYVSGSQSASATLTEGLEKNVMNI